MIDSPMFPSHLALDMSVPVASDALSPELQGVLQEERERMARILRENGLKPQTDEQVALERQADFMMLVELRVYDLENALVAMKREMKVMQQRLDDANGEIRVMRPVVARAGADQAKTGGSHA